ncbi:histidine kinase [Phyllobacterium phragmitis]|uniref:Histidine kinase n=1 Tax=Phyllobacterium phragmitis TaxID=2670329 RepID=A0A2S9IVG7_9HYPH|nr:histidine kinase [Phyllobacterium phragmitis]
MPTLTRLILSLAAIALLVYGGMVALVTFVHPVPGETTIRIPPEKLNPKPRQASLSQAALPIAGASPTVAE